MDNSSAFDVRSPWYWLPPTLFFVCALVIGMEGYNRPLFLVMHQLGWHIPPVCWGLVTFFGGTLTALPLLLLLARRYPQILWAALLAGLISIAWSHGLKAGLNVSRPPAVLGPDFLHVIGPRLKHGSFPSGHATTAFTIAGIVALQLGQWSSRLILLVFAVVVGISRIMVGVHWPVDVLVGAGGGWLSAGAGLWFSNRWPGGVTLRRVLLVLFILAGVAMSLVDSRYPGARWLAIPLTLLTVPFGLLAFRATLRGET